MDASRKKRDHGDPQYYAESRNRPFRAIRSSDSPDSMVVHMHIMWVKNLQ